MVKCFPERDKWQKQTLNEMEWEFLGKTFGDSYSNEDAKRVVTVYGHPQVGKTTLILELMGINEKYHEIVHKSLRAGQPKGDSSTSTVIVYRVSRNEKWGISYRETGSMANDYVKEFETGESFEDELKSVRQIVENGNRSWEYISIHIPQSYFLSADNSRTLNIVDLPGVGSRNVKESKHVYGLIEDYIIHSSVSIIVWEAHKMNSLKDEKIPGAGDMWPGMGRKFMLVLTRAYSEDNVRRMISNDDRCFQKIRKHYRDELKRGFPSIFDNDLEFFLVDIGESIRRMPDVIRDSVINTVQKELCSIRESILDREGNALFGRVQALKAYSERIKLKKKREIEKETDKERKKQKRALDETAEWGEKLSKTDSALDLEMYIKRIENSILKIDGILESLEDDEDTLWKSICKEFEIHFDYSHLKIPEKVKEQNVDSIINDCLENQYLAKQSVRDLSIELYLGDEMNGSNDRSTEDIPEEIDFEKMIVDIFDQIPIDEGNWSSVIGESIKTGIRKKVFKSFKSYKVRVIIYHETKRILSDLKEYLIERFKELSKVAKNKKNYYEKKRAEHLFMNKRIEEKNRAIIEIDSNLENLERMRGENEDGLIKIKNYLYEYFRVAKEQYENQKREVIGIMNSNEVDSLERMELFFLLGLMEKDYNKLVADRSI